MSSATVGRYEILSELARGGMATVYLAHDPRFNRRVAIKILPRAFTHDPQFLARFQQEAEAVASLEHQYVVPVYDFGDEDGQPYLVMRYMGGGSLSERIRQGAIPFGEAVAILKPIAAALDYAHQRGIIHRDVKPANILFDQTGGAYLSDFGIAKLAESTATFTGQVAIGTPAYMSPEQIQGGAPVDARTDVYALGITLYEMLSGEVPYKGETTTQQLMKHILEPVPRITEVSPNIAPEVEQVLMRSLAKDREARFPTAGALTGALEATSWDVPGARTQRVAVPPSSVTPTTPVPFVPFTPDAPPRAVAAVDPGSPSRPPRPRKSRLLAIVGVVLLFMLLVGGGAVLGMQAWGAARESTPAAELPVAETTLTAATVKITSTVTTSDKRSVTATVEVSATPTHETAATPAAEETQEAGSLSATPEVSLTPVSTAAPTHSPTATPSPTPYAATTTPTPTIATTHAATTTPTPTTAPTHAVTTTPTPTATLTYAATETPSPAATSTAQAGPLTLSHTVEAVWCVTQKTYRIRFSFYVGGGTGQHGIYRDVDSQVVYGPGGERSVLYELDWGAESGAVGTFYARSGDQRVESKFYVNSPDCKAAPAP